jgi:hypothetical protein
MSAGWKHRIDEDYEKRGEMKRKVQNNEKKI